MFKNYLKIAVKSLYKHRLQSAINILGMTVGLSCCLLISLFVIDELGYDAFFPNADRIYRVSRDTFVGTSYESREATNAPQVAALLEENFTEVEIATRVNNMPVLIKRDDNVYYENNFLYADNNFFDIFAFNWVQGSPAQALAEPFSIVLTESVAGKYFNGENPLGQVLTLDNNFALRVTGVIADLPANTHLRSEAFISIETLASTAGTENALDQWGNNNFHTYIRLAPGVDIGNIESRFADFVERFMGGAEGSQGLEMAAINIRDIHLHSEKDYELKPGGSMAAVFSFSIIALCIVLIAGINFMNLSTARYTQRAREVGLRKTLGAVRGQLVQQFMSESMLLILLSVLLALVLTEFLLPAFSTFTGKALSLEVLYSPGMIAALAAFVVGTGLFTGSYPAFFLSSIQPARVLKGNFSRRFSGVMFRNALVILQFAIAIVLLVATSVVYLQMQYANSQARGFDRDRIVVLTGSQSRGVGTQWETMKQRLLEHPGISAITASDQVPLNTVDRTGPITIAGNTEEGRIIPRMHVDYGFFQTYGIDVVAGRDFMADRNDAMRQVGGNVTRSYMINETAATEFGWTVEEAVGQQIAYLFVPGTVVGVVRDSYFESVKDAIKPMVYFLPPADDPLPLASIRLTGTDLSNTLVFIDDTWREFMPDYPLQRRFLAQDFNTLYQSEQQQGELFRYFSLLAVFIACFGLLGLATFVAERRTKEIGVRKVLGGSVWSIVLLLTNDFSKLVLISNVIAWPVAYFVMNQWLANFAYRIDLSPLIFIGSGLIALCIAWVTVGGTAAKAASQKPVLALRYE
jgi:putative ABC transport system permease protein